MHTVSSLSAAAMSDFAGILDSCFYGEDADRVASSAAAANADLLSSTLTQSGILDANEDQGNNILQVGSVELSNRAKSYDRDTGYMR